NEPDHFGRATITYAFNQTKYLGELRYYLRSDGTVENQVNRYVPLDADIPDDPQAADTVNTAHNDFTNMQKTSMDASPQPTPPPPRASASCRRPQAACSATHRPTARISTSPPTGRRLNIRDQWPVASGLWSVMSPTITSHRLTGHWPLATDH